MSPPFGWQHPRQVALTAPERLARSLAAFTRRRSHYFERSASRGGEAASGRFPSALRHVLGRRAGKPRIVLTERGLLIDRRLVLREHRSGLRSLGKMATSGSRSSARLISARPSWPRPASNRYQEWARCASVRLGLSSRARCKSDGAGGLSGCGRERGRRAARARGYRCQCSRSERSDTPMRAAPIKR